MQYIGRWFAVLALLLSGVAWAGPAEDQAALEAAFQQLLSGKYLEAEAGFVRSGSTAPEGSLVRLLSARGEELARTLGSKGAKKVSVDLRPHQEAFAVLLSRDWVNARVLFLTAAASAPEGSAGREIAYSFAEFARSAPASVVETPEVPGSLPVFAPPPEPDSVPAGIPSSGPAAPEAEAASEASGQIEMIVDGAAFGIFSTLAGAILAGLGEDQDDAPALALLSIGGAVAGGTLGHFYVKARGGKLSRNQTNPITLGALLGAGQGLLALPLLGFTGDEADDKKKALGTIWASTATGMIAGGVVSSFATPSRSDTALVGSATAWGSIVSLGILGTLNVNDGQIAFKTVNAGYLAGAAGGILFATQVDLEPRRLSRINRSGGIGLIAGSLAGGIIAGSIAGAGSEENALTLFSATALLGGIGGLMYGVYVPPKAPTKKAVTKRAVKWGLAPTLLDQKTSGVSVSASF